MKLRNMTLGALMAAAMLAAAAGMAQSQPAAPASGAAAQQLDDADQGFLENAAQLGHAEIEGARMAQEKASNPDVKAFAEKMVHDHTKVGNELKTLAQAKGYTLPAEPSLLQQAKLKTLTLTDDGFDEMYADQLGVSAHEDAVKLFQDASANAKDPQIKAFAAEHLPALQDHLKMARDIKQQVTARK
ncbi:DUF4142 domain-containing protein [Bordetella petrii]|uniref:DUF4142 domain-containing protein n=1 Tax=Bordetella petrii TaxID=94624 RepID=UPI001E586E2A|nr:DUF4142 domain-containing protein [Bordetella petrii]MCD0501694.1 DUF4142 domain-containing protein [Bordetella petrii]